MTEEILVFCSWWFSNQLDVVSETHFSCDTADRGKNQSKYENNLGYYINSDNSDVNMVNIALIAFCSLAVKKLAHWSTSSLRRRNTRYQNPEKAETNDNCSKLSATRYKNLQRVAQHCFVASFGSMFRVFHFAWSTCRATKMFVDPSIVAGWRKLLRKVERGSTLSNKFWLCCSFFIKLTTYHTTNFLKISENVRGLITD